MNGDQKTHYKNVWTEQDTPIYAHNNLILCKKIRCYIIDFFELDDAYQPESSNKHISFVGWKYGKRLKFVRYKFIIKDLTFNLQTVFLV